MRRLLVPAILTLIGILMLAGGYTVISSRRTTQPERQRETVPIATTPTVATAPGNLRPVEPSIASAQLTELKKGPAALTLIDDASTRYDPSAIPIIAPYLDHPEPEVRAAAIDAFLRLGERDAAVLLRAAAKRREDPKEIVALLQAADYLELPSATDVRKARHTTRQPTAQNAP